MVGILWVIDVTFKYLNTPPRNVHTREIETAFKRMDFLGPMKITFFRHISEYGKLLSDPISYDCFCRFDFEVFSYNFPVFITIALHVLVFWID